MISLRVFVLMAPVLLMLAVAAGADIVAEDDTKPSITVRADELGRRVIVIGRLESPLHSVLTVSGVWLKPGELEADQRVKRGEVLWFAVDELNGKRLESSVKFRDLDVAVCESNGNAVPPAMGVRWVLQAYETWPDYGHPIEFEKELGQQLAGRPSRSATRLIGVLKRM